MYALSYRRARRIMASLGIRTRLARHFEQMDRLLARRREKAARRAADALVLGPLDDQD